MANSAPKRARVCEEENVVQGYLHSVSPVKISAKKAKYFDCILQMSRDEYRKAVVFDAGKHGRFEQAAAERTPLKLGNVEKSLSELYLCCRMHACFIYRPSKVVYCLRASVHGCFCEMI